MTDGPQRLSAVIHGTPKIGKSWLGESSPGPVLILDGEGSTDFLKRKHRTLWTPSSPPPRTRADGTPLGLDDIVVVKVLSWTDVSQAHQWIMSNDHPFRSFVLDTVTEIQQRLKDSIRAGGFELWQEMLDKMATMARQWRDLLDRPDANLYSIMVLAQTYKAADDWQRPDVQGQLQRKLGSYFDVVGLLRPRQEPGELVLGRELVVAPYSMIEAGDRTDTLSRYYPNGIIPNPDVTELVRLINT